LTEPPALYYYEYMRMRINCNGAGEIQGHPRTRQRELLLKLLRQAGGHLDARGLFRLAADQDSSISQATVYRSLKLFKDLGLVDEKRLGQARCSYELSRHSQHQHLSCSKCGKVIDFECPLNEMVEKVKQEYSFTVTKAEVCFEGYCADCNAKVVKD
jgi:Fur family transcriptional regulator, ferric uptake regulator